MKIGVITDTYYPQLNGVTVSVDNFVRGLRALGHEVYIFAPLIKNHKDTDKNIFRIPSFKVISSEPEVLVPLPVPRQSYGQIFRINFDLIHAHGNGAFSFFGCQVAKLRGVPFILTFHTLHTKYTHYFLNGKVVRPGMVALGLRMFADICDGIITPSEKMKDELITYGVKKQIKVIPGFVDYSRFQKRKKGYLHKRFFIPKDHKILLTVGRLGKEKNFPFLINMFKKLQSQEKNTDFVIAGQGGELNSLKRLAEKLGLSKTIHFTKKAELELMPDIYRDADIFIFASTTETQGICVLEAAASGLPIVVVRDPAFDSLVIDGETGFSVSADQEIFAQKTIQLLRDNNLRRQFGNRAKEIARKNFESKYLTKQLLEYYKKVLSTYKPRVEMLRKINRATLVPLFRATTSFLRQHL
ncbi:MAG: glycosyltransferase [Candidatus Levybacteria bacterium]|nr:glycosyltransferase [Candidatus Levybacteria bacterium]